MTYSQTDIELPSSQVSFDLQRNYNSQSKIKNMFGVGWSDSLHKELYKTSSSGAIVFRDSDGSMYGFSKNRGNYTCDETKDYELEETDKVERYETKEYTYDVGNRLSTCITTNGEKEVVNQENLYNGNGQRIQKKEGASVVNYFYQDGVVLYTADKDGNKTSQNFVGMDGNIIGTTRYSGEGFKYYTYNKDIQGSTTSVVGQDGISPVAYDYDDFGVTTSIGDSTFFNEVWYTGGIYDVSTGLYYLNARYYDPNNGRFITQDTYRGEINEPNTQHLYAYCHNNPINYIDPSGHKDIYINKWYSGFSYNSKGKYFYSKKNCWQRKYGYNDIYDGVSRFAGCNITYLKSYFTYKNKKGSNKK